MLCWGVLCCVVLCCVVLCCVVFVFVFVLYCCVVLCCTLLHLNLSPTRTLVDEDKEHAGQSWQVWAKPQANGSTAILIINTGGGTGSFSVSLTKYGAAPGAIRDIWQRKDLPVDQHNPPTMFNVDQLASHDSRFLLITPAASKRAVSSE